MVPATYCCSQLFTARPLFLTQNTTPPLLYSCSKHLPSLAACNLYTSTLPLRTSRPPVPEYFRVGGTLGQRARRLQYCHSRSLPAAIKTCVAALAFADCSYSRLLTPLLCLFPQQPTVLASRSSFHYRSSLSAAFVAKHVVWMLICKVQTVETLTRRWNS